MLPDTDYLHPGYYAESPVNSAGRIDALLAKLPADRRKLSNTGVEAFRTGRVGESSTCFEHIHRSFQPGKVSLPSGDPMPLKEALIKTLSENLTYSKDPVIALSGGIDSFLLGCLLKEILGRPPRAATLVSNLPGYCEGDATLRLAEQLGFCDIEVIEVNEEAFVANLPQVISACEVPLYNLHPVSKWLFARSLQKRGHTSCITGDGADQIAAGKIAYDYLPLLAPLFKDHEVGLTCPFLSPPVIKSIQSRGSDPEKQIIRELAMRYLPEDFMHQPKRPCFTPPIDLSRYDVAGSIEPENRGHLSDRDQVFRTTLALLKQSHLKEEKACAPLPV